MRRSVRIAVYVGALAAGCTLQKHPDDEQHASAPRRPSATEAPALGVGPEVDVDRVTIVGGVFVMGTSEGSFDERPPHEVRLPTFRLDRHEVTNERFERFVEASGRRPEGPWRRGFAFGHEKHPVRYISWHDAQAFCHWSGGRLPTEAEWEAAARGPRAQRYPWGNTWIDGAARAGAPAEAGPSPVGSHPDGVTSDGLHDMAGNVWEWVADWYDRWLYESRSGVTESPTGPPDDAPPELRFVNSGTAAGNERSTRKVMRGGGWTGDGPETTRSAKRMSGRPDAWYGDTGFRCACPSPKPNR